MEYAEPGNEEWHRQLIALAHRTDSPRGSLWWISFADESGWLGACLVEAQNAVEAISRTHHLGINPGGELAIRGPIEPGHNHGFPLDELLTDPRLADLDQP